jgi:hypothetical protein
MEKRLGEIFRYSLLVRLSPNLLSPCRYPILAPPPRWTPSTFK